MILRRLIFKDVKTSALLDRTQSWFLIIPRNCDTILHIYQRRQVQFILGRSTRSNIPCEPLTTSPRDALTSRQTTGCSWPVRIASGEGLSPEEKFKERELKHYVTNSHYQTIAPATITPSNTQYSPTSLPSDINFSYLPILPEHVQRKHIAATDDVIGLAPKSATMISRNRLATKRTDDQPECFRASMLNSVFRVQWCFSRDQVVSNASGQGTEERLQVFWPEE